jgi:glycosyltransferase involved in cell wall biosynthesis
MRIVICSNVYPPNFIGGAEIIAHYQAKALAALGHKVSVYTGDHKLNVPRHHARDERFDGLDVRRIRLTEQDFHALNVTFSHPRVEADFEAYLQTVRPDVVHFHNVSGLSIKIISLARRFGCKTVVTLHDYWGFCFKNTAMRTPSELCEQFENCHECLSHIDDGQSRRIPIRLRQDIFKVILREDVDLFISPSRYLAETYVRAGFDPARMRVLWNGVDAERFARVQRNPLPDTVRFSFFGHFGWHKGLHTLIDALAQLPDPTRARINLVGDGELKQSYVNAVEANGCRHLVRFWGKIDNRDVEKAYGETDVLVLPSLWRENQPVSITEAMAAGIPVIASDMGGSGELVRHGVTGLLFPAEDVHALAHAMQRFIDEPRLLDTMGEAGRDRIREVTFSTQALHLQRLYRDASSARTQRDPAPIVACVGARFPEGSDAIPASVEQRIGRPVRFVHADWLTKSQAEDVAIRWRVDDADSPGGAHEALFGESELISPPISKAASWIAAVLRAPDGER